MSTDLLERVKSALADRYAIESEIGRGGMATVFLAEDRKHRRKVAIKVLHPELAASLGTARFLREIETVAGLDHPHILPLHDSGEADGLLYYVMPFVEGESLRERLEREGQLPIDQALSIAVEVADGLDYAHRQAVVHRDIKPGNILLAENHARIADFGVARALGVASEGDATVTGLAVGTPKYMSPEQAAGSAEVDGRADIYALGCVLYEMLAGDPPFDAPTPQAIMARKASETVPGLRVRRKTVPADLEAVIARAMATAPADRFSTAEEFAAALEAPEGLGRAIRRRRVLRPVLNAAAVIVLLATVIWFARLITSGAGPVDDSTVELNADAIAVLPFQYVGTSDVLRTLAESVPVDFWGLVGGEFGPVSADQGAVKDLWTAAGGTVQTQVAEARALEIAEAVGAGGVVQGVVTGTEEEMSLTATLLEVPSGLIRVRRTKVEGPPGEYDALVKKLINQLLATDYAAWTRPDLPVLREHKPEAVQAYLRGDLHEALALDSTFIFVASLIYMNGERDHAAASYAWEHQDELRPFDRAYLRALAGWRFGATRTLVEQFAQFDSALKIPGFEEWLSDVPWQLWAWGSLIDLPGYRERAKTDLLRGREEGLVYPLGLMQLSEIAAAEGDTAGMRRYAEGIWPLADSAEDSVKAVAASLRVALMQGDTAAARGLWEEVDAVADSALGNLDPLLILLVDGQGLEGLDRFMLSEQEARPGARRNRWTGLAWARARGRYQDWSAIRDLLYGRAGPLRMPVLSIRDVLFLREPEDSAVLAAASWLDSVAAGTIIVPPPSDDPTPSIRVPTLARCWSTLWKVAHGDTEGARETVRYLRQEVLLPYRYSVCAGLIKVLVAEQEGGDIRSAVASLDSIVRPVPMEAPGWPLDRDGTGWIDNLFLSRTLVLVGDTAGALMAARRAKPWNFFQTEVTGGIFVDLLREEARLTAMVGDTAGAIDAYEHYFALRDFRPDHLPWAAQWDSMQVEYGALTGVEGP